MPEVERLRAEADQYKLRMLQMAGDIELLREASRDALSGWRYIRRRYGDLSGVGWHRVELKLMEALNPMRTEND